MGPLVSSRQLATGHVASWTAAWRRAPAVATGGGRPAGLPAANEGGYFLQPTVLTDTDHSMRVVREEIFGPVLVAMRWRDVDDLVAKANDSPYGLSAGVWTNDLRQAHRIAAAIKAGTVWVNCYNLTDPGVAVRRLQGVRLGPRDGPPGPRGVHRDQERLGEL